jgi:ketosteroid isomerase-like protein
MPAQNIDAVIRMFDAFNSEDIERILELTDPDFEVEVPADLSAEPDVYRGHDGMRRYFHSFRDAMEEIRFRPEAHWDAGADVVVAMLITARGRRTGIAVEQRTAGVWTLRDGRALRIRMFASADEALAAVGLAG